MKISISEDPTFNIYGRFIFNSNIHNIDYGDVVVNNITVLWSLAKAQIFAVYSIWSNISRPDALEESK